MRKYRLLFIGSLLLGIMVIVLTGSRFWFEDGILGSETLERLRSMDIHGSHFFMYLLVRHLAVTGVLLLLSNTMYGRFAVKCFILWQGVLFGMYAAAACMQYQLRGALFVSGSLFPHQFVLIPSYVLLIYWCLNEQYIRRRKPWLVLWIFIGIALGCLLESYVNPILIKDILQFF